MNLVAEFETADALIHGARRARDDGFQACDMLTPYPLAEIEEILPSAAPRIRVSMAVAGFGTAVVMFALESWSAAVAYPFNEGGRPYFSWQVFGLVPFEVGVLAAGIAGFVAVCMRCGLPRLYHPLFDVDGIERASQDRFFLLFDRPEDDGVSKLHALLVASGALRVVEAAA